MTEISPQELQKISELSSQIRRDIIRMVHGVQSGHPGGSLGCADFFVLMYHSILNIDREKFNYQGDNEDLFFLSNGHISPVWYSTLARTTNYFEAKELNTFRRLNTRLQGHPATEENLPGIRVASGSLGQGLSVSIGAALSKKLNKDQTSVYVLMGDGEQQEGQIWEAAMFAAKNQVDNLIGVVDWNDRQIDGDVKDILGLQDLDEKYRSFGWEVLVCNGNDLPDLSKALLSAQGFLGNGKPIMVLMKTEMGFGVDFMMGSHKWHGIPPNDEQKIEALSQLKETIGDY